MTDKTCAERIAEQMKGREQYVAALYAVSNGDATTVDGEEMTDEEAHDALDELPLGIGVVRILRVDLSTGGPADYLTAELDGYEVQNVTYHFADWFDHAEASVPQGSPLWDLAERFAEQVEQ